MSDVKFRKLKDGQWVLIGPAEELSEACAGRHKVHVERKDGHVRHILLENVGKAFQRDGESLCYGYYKQGANPDGSIPVPRPDPMCAAGHVGRHDAKFCGECGLPLSAPEPALVGS